MRKWVRLSTRQLNAVASSRTSNSSKTTSSDNHPESFVVDCSSTEAAETRFGTQPVATAVCRTPHFHMLSHCAARIDKLKSKDCLPEKILLHASWIIFAPHLARNTSTRSFSTYLSCVTVFLNSESRPVVPDCIDPLRRSTAGWQFPGTPILHRLWAQKDRAQQDETHEIKELTTRKILRKLVSNRCLTANHWYIQPAIRQSALRRHPTRTSKTSNYVWCWLHHWKYGNEKKMIDKQELITLNEKAWWSILLVLKYRENWCGVCTEARSNCTTNTSLWLKKRKFDYKFFSGSPSFRETLCSFLVPRWIESKHVFWKRPK